MILSFLSEEPSSIIAQYKRADPVKGGTSDTTLKERLAIFLFPAGMSLTKLSLNGNFYYSRPVHVWFLRSRLGKTKSLSFFYSVSLYICFVFGL
jgi:hypothetical protein